MAPYLYEPTLSKLAADVDEGAVLLLITGFLEEIETRRERIEHAVSVQDRATVSHEIHALKSVSGTFGARALFDFAAEKDALMKASSGQALGPLYEEFLKTFDQTVHAYQTYMACHV